MYGCELFASCEEKLNVIFKSILRYVYSLRRYDHVSCHFLMLYGISFDNLLSIRVLLFLLKIIYLESSRYLSDKIRFAKSLRGKGIIIPLHRYHASEWHFFIHSARLWNCLPHSQQLNSNAISVRKSLYNFFAP